MSTTVTVNGTSYAVPAEGDSSWATDVSNLLIALATSTKVLQTSSSTFTLTTDVNFGATYGPVATYYKSRGTNPASAGVFRLANAENISWRNAANSADLSLKLSASDWLQFNSVNLADISTAQTLTNKTLTAPVLNSPTGLAKADVGLGNVDNTSDATKDAATATLTNKTISGSSNTLSNIAYSSLNLSTSIVNADISTSAAIARSKLATLSASKAVVTDGFGYDIASTTTSTEIGYLGGVTSAVQTQLDAKVSKSTATTKGDIFVATASATVVRQGVGTDTHVLTADSTQTNGIKWAAPSLAPTGSVTMYAGATAPTGYLLCDGSAVSRTTYADLFAICSTTYGVGDGSTTFNVPDARGVFVRGAGTQTISSIDYTGTRGTTQGDQMQGHVHNYERPNHSTDAVAGANRITSINDTTTATSTPVTDGANGTPRYGSETRPANITLSYIIKT